MSKKLNVLLDLDQTVISSVPWETFDSDENENKVVDHFHNGWHDMEGYYIVFERPDLQKFLDYLFKNFNVYVWTAASKDYALFIIQNCLLKKKNRKLECIFFSYHCDKARKHFGGTKNLRLLWERYGLEGVTPQNTVIIDDLGDVHKTQPKNCIAIEPFEFEDEGSEGDSVLLGTIKPQLKKMNSEYVKREENGDLGSFVPVAA